jgi:hypothetical protein
VLAERGRWAAGRAFRGRSAGATRAAASLDAHIRLAHDRGLGFGVWRLGRETRRSGHPLLADPLGWPG